MYDQLATHVVVKVFLCPLYVFFIPILYISYGLCWKEQSAYWQLLTCDIYFL